MEIKGEDFIKKVHLKQEESEIEQRLNEIKNAQTAYEEQQNYQESQPRLSPDLDNEVKMQEEQEYSDIMLGKTSSSPSKNNDNKKKYLVLGLILLILFLLTIVIIRLLTNDQSVDESFSKKSNKENTQTILEDENIEDQYQKIINEKLKNIKDDDEQNNKIIESNSPNLQEIEKEEQAPKEVIVENKKPDIFDLKKEEPKPVVKETVEKAIKQPLVKNEPKPIVKKTAPKQVSKKSTTKLSGIFIQIGAFTKAPDDKYLQNITKKGFKYKIYKVSINNRMFNKLLIGPYNSRAKAKLAIDDIKKQLNVSGAFILTL